MKKKSWIFVLVLWMVLGTVANAQGQKTQIITRVEANGAYTNWDGTSNVAQFTDAAGNYCFAVNGKKYVRIFKTKNGQIEEKHITIRRPHSLFGNVVMDEEDNIYLISGVINKNSAVKKNTIFISKYNQNGKKLMEVGDPGNSSLAGYYGDDFLTQVPFDAGNCAVAYHNGVLVVDYGRLMYSGHQSDSVLAVHTSDLSKVSLGDIYNSHSFAQRVVPYQDGFILASEGDCYNRAFTVRNANPLLGQNTSYDIFHFWIRRGAMDDYDMGDMNENFAHMGSLVNVDNQLVALGGTSVKALNKDAKRQNEQLFIQIFDPTKNLDEAEAYVTTDIRTGLSGPNGNESVTDHGIKWLTNVASNTRIENPQMVSDGQNTILVLFEKYVNYRYQGVFYLKVSKEGKITQGMTCFSKHAHLNPCQMPVYTNNRVYWTANNSASKKNNLYIYSLKVN